MTTTPRDDRSGGGGGCLGCIGLAVLVWALAFGVRWAGERYEVWCGRGGEIEVRRVP